MFMVKSVIYASIHRLPELRFSRMVKMIHGDRGSEDLRKQTSV